MADEFRIPTVEELAAMRDVDVRTVDKGTLVDIKDVVIDPALSQQERMLSFIQQIKNPYCYLDHGIVVKVSFQGERTLEDSLTHYLHTIEG